MVRTKYEVLYGKKRDYFCTAITKKNEQCRNKACKGAETCGIHTEKSECPVCYDVKAEKSLSCGHTLCHDCSRSWFATKSTCPMCRTVVSKTPARRYNDISRLVDRLEELRELESIAESYLAMRMENGTDTARAYERLRTLVEYNDI